MLKRLKKFITNATAAKHSPSSEKVKHNVLAESLKNEHNIRR